MIKTSKLVICNWSSTGGCQITMNESVSGRYEVSVLQGALPVSCSISTAGQACQNPFIVSILSGPAVAADSFFAAPEHVIISAGSSIIYAMYAVDSYRNPASGADVALTFTRDGADYNPANITQVSSSRENPTAPLQFLFLLFIALLHGLQSTRYWKVLLRSCCLILICVNCFVYLLQYPHLGHRQGCNIEFN